MQITVGQLRALINEAGAPKKKKGLRNGPGPGFKKKASKKTVKKPSPRKAGKGKLLSKSDLAKPRKETPAMVMAKLVVALRGQGLKFLSKEKNSGARRTWFNFMKDATTPDRDAEHVHEERVAKIVASLNAVGIKPIGYKTNSDGTEIDIPGGYITVTNEYGRQDIGTDVVISLYDGPRAHQEEMGMDTGDMEFEPL